MSTQDDFARHLLLRIAVLFEISAWFQDSSPTESAFSNADPLAEVFPRLLSVIGVANAGELAGALKSLENSFSLAGIEPPLSRIERVAKLGELEINLLLVLAIKSIGIPGGETAPAHIKQSGDHASSILTFEQVRRLMGGLHPVGALEEIFLEGSSALLDFGLCDRVSDGSSDPAKASLRLRQHVLSQLMGEVAIHPGIEVLLSDLPPVVVRYESEFPPAALATGFVYVNSPSTGLALYRIAQLLSERGGGNVMWLDLRKVPENADLSRMVRIAQIDAVVNRATLVIGPREAPNMELPLLFEGLDAPKGRTVLFGKEHWIHGFGGLDPYCWEAPRLSDLESATLWSSELALDANDELIEKLRPLPLLPEQILESVRLVRLGAAESKDVPEFAQVITAVREISFEQLGNLARRVVPGVSWQNLIVPERVSRELHWLCDRYRYRRLVGYQWQMKPGGGRGDGISALFTGDSGTGKTMAAEVVADALGLDLLVINLSTLVDKYVGETEKNLEKIFAGADSAPGLVFFDEADSIFGKRSEVNESNDRFANIQVSYLLQRIESFNGLAILSSNLRANIDEAFMRRLDLVIDFPLPDVAMRQQLWHSFLGGGVPLANDIEWEFLAKSFVLAGGNIRSAASSAAYLAVAEQREVSMKDVVTGVVLEYRKLGRLLSEAEFSHWSHILKWV